MKYDKPLLAVMIGFLLAILLEIYTQIFKYFGLNQLSGFELTSIMMYKNGSWWIGLLHLVVLVRWQHYRYMNLEGNWGLTICLLRVQLLEQLHMV